MSKRTSAHYEWLLKELGDPTVATGYLNAALSESPEMFAIALRNVAESYGGELEISAVLGDRRVRLRAFVKSVTGMTDKAAMRVQELPPYSYRVFWDEASSEYVAECQEIPGLSGIGATAPAAVAELQEAVAGWLEVLEAQGVPLPSPELQNHFSDARPAD